jgi:hypothetical protein
MAILLISTFTSLLVLFAVYSLAASKEHLQEGLFAVVRYGVGSSCAWCLGRRIVGKDRAGSSENAPSSTNPGILCKWLRSASAAKSDSRAGAAKCQNRER